jgi:hypothetical protein
MKSISFGAIAVDKDSYEVEVEPIGKINLDVSDKDFSSESVNLLGRLFKKLQ